MTQIEMLQKLLENPKRRAKYSDDNTFEIAVNPTNLSIYVYNMTLKNDCGNVFRVRANNSATFIIIEPEPEKVDTQTAIIAYIKGKTITSVCSGNSYSRECIQCMCRCTESELKREWYIND